MGLFDNVNPGALKSGAEKLISDLNDRDFRNWYKEFQSTDKWRDYHKSAIETLLQYISDYYESMKEALDVLPPMADLIKEYKELEKELEQLKREYASAAPEERASIAYEIEAVQNEMEMILREIEELSNTTVETMFNKEIDPNLYDSEPIMIDDSYIRSSRSQYDRIVYELDNLHHYFTGNSELGGARNAYVSNITHQIGEIFINMMDILNEGKSRWDTFNAAFDEAERSLERTVNGFDVKGHNRKTENFVVDDITVNNSEVTVNHEEQEQHYEKTVEEEDSFVTVNTEREFEDDGYGMRVDSTSSEFNSALGETQDINETQVTDSNPFNVTSDYTNRKNEEHSNVQTDNFTVNANMADNKVPEEGSSRVERTDTKLTSELSDSAKIPEEEGKVKVEDSKIGIEEYEATADKKFDDSKLNVDNYKTTSEYETRTDY